MPKVSIFMAVTTKIVREKAQKWPKMARFWPKSCYNGRVMAREVFFYHWLWVTKFCAKFGCSRTPRTASMHNSFIVLRFMWKEPAPLSKVVKKYEFMILRYSRRRWFQQKLPIESWTMILGSCHRRHTRRLSGVILGDGGVCPADTDCGGGQDHQDHPLLLYISSMHQAMLVRTGEVIEPMIC